jgi:peroxiredoxin
MFAKPYNYETFTRDLFMKDLGTKITSPGPKPGERAPDFEGRTLDGDLIRLRDYEGEKNVVLTFGSVTCPMTAGSISGVNDLYEEFAGEDVEFLFVYVREAHPGDRIPAHESMNDKVRAAELLRYEEDVEIPIIVDDLKGTIHKQYGKMPNPTYIIDRSGRVAFKSLWSRTSALKEALEDLLERQEERGVDHAIVAGGEDTNMPSARIVLHTFRALERGGDKSLDDFREALGTPGKLAVVTSRLAEPIAVKPGRALVGALLAGAVITGALFAGRALRQRRFASRSPYDLHEPTRPSATASGDYEAVGI